MLDASDFSNLTAFISIPTTDEKCSHGFLWSQDDPRVHNWIFSNNIKIAHTSFVSKKERKMYYRRTLGSCNCKLLYNGSDDLFVRSSRASHIHQSASKLGYTVNLVSYSLLIDFITDFFRHALIKNYMLILGFFSKGGVGRSHC